MTTPDWIAIGGIAVPVILGIYAWARRVERHMTKALTEERHDEICTKRTADLQKSVDQIRNDMDRRHQENREALVEIRDSITGTHKMLYDFLLKDRSGGR